MKRLSILLVVVGAVLWLGTLQVQRAEEPKGKEQTAPGKVASNEKAAASEKEVDITEQVREMNSDKFLPPPSQFRTGHVTPRRLDPKAIQKTDAGFTIQLPSGAPIPTPTVHDGKLFVSGGFHSKEFYCFEADTGKLIWALDLDDDGPSSAVSEDGVTVFNTESCTLFAVDAKTGKLLWSYWLGDPLMSTPTIAHGRVFTSYPAASALAQTNPAANQAPNQEDPPAKTPPEGEAKGGKAAGKSRQRPSASHALACFDLKTGKILWQRWIDSDVMSAPVAVDKELYVTSFAGTVYRFNQADGAILSAKKTRATSAPVIAGKDVYYTKRVDAGKDAAAEEAVAIVDPVTQETKAEANRRKAEYLDKTVQRQAEYAAKGAQLDAGNGFAGGAPASANAEPALNNVGQGNVSTLQAFQGSRILNYRDNNFNVMGDEVFCTDPTSGKMRWSFKLSGDLKKVGGSLAAPPAAAGGQVFVGTLKGEVLQMNPKDGKLSKTYKIGSPIRCQPIIEGGRIYVGTDNGKLVCIDTGNKDFTGWSTWGGNAAHTGVQK